MRANDSTNNNNNNNNNVYKVFDSRGIKLEIVLINSNIFLQEL